MKKKNIYFLGVVFYFLSLRVEDQFDQPYLRLRIEGKEYDALYLAIIHTDNRRRKHIRGITEDGQNWLFLYPDSLYERHSSMSIQLPENDSVWHTLDFHIPREGQSTLRAGDFSFERQSTIYAQFIRTIRETNVPFIRYRDWIRDIFLVSYDNDKVLSASLVTMSKGFSMFWCDLSYEEQLQKYIDMTIANPSSRFLIATVYRSLSNYNSIDDIKKIFSHFSEENRESHFGRRISLHIERYLNMTFENVYLPAWDTGQIEPVIQDTTKYTLVVFSASWCAPCHALIPVFKEIHHDLHYYLNLVYISIDEPETVQNWKNLMIEKDIPWRSLLAVDDVRGFRDRYLVSFIPYSLLVHPDGKIERLGVNVMRVYEVVR